MPTAERLANIIDLGEYRTQRRSAERLYYAFRDLAIALAEHRAHPHRAVNESPYRAAAGTFEAPRSNRAPWGGSPRGPATIRPPRKAPPEPQHHLLREGRMAICGTVDASFTGSPDKITCQKCQRRAALDVLTRREAGEPPRWNFAVEERLLRRLRRLDRKRNERRVARRAAR